MLCLLSSTLTRSDPSLEYLLVQKDSWRKRGMGVTLLGSVLKHILADMSCIQYLKHGLRQEQMQ